MKLEKNIENLLVQWMNESEEIIDLENVNNVAKFIADNVRIKKKHTKKYDSLLDVHDY